MSWKYYSLVRVLPLSMSIIVILFISLCTLDYYLLDMSHLFLESASKTRVSPVIEEPTLKKNRELIITYQTRVYNAKAYNSYLGQREKNIINTSTLCHIFGQHITVNIVCPKKGHFEYWHNRSVAAMYHRPDVFYDSEQKSEIQMLANKGKVLILQSAESPLWFNQCTSDECLSNFNLRMGYQFPQNTNDKLFAKHNIFVPYITHKDIMLILRRNKRTDFDALFEAKVNNTLVAWIGSNCKAPNHRTTILRRFFNFVKFKGFGYHSYGTCLNNYNDSLITQRKINPATVIAKYPFYVAIENSNCLDYISEKLTNALLAQSIPIIMTKSVHDRTTNTSVKLPNYDLFVPKGTYIDLADYGDWQHLLDTLLGIANNKTLYRQYLPDLRNPSQKKEWHTILERLKEMNAMYHISNHSKESIGGELVCKIGRVVTDYIHSNERNYLKTDWTLCADNQ